MGRYRVCGLGPKGFTAKSAVKFGDSEVRGVEFEHEESRFVLLRLK